MYFLINLVIVVIYLTYLVKKETKINPVGIVVIFILGLFIPVPVLKLLF